MAGWWFQTFSIFHNIWDNPSGWLIFFKMVIAPPTRWGWFLFRFVGQCSTSFLSMVCHDFPLPILASPRGMPLVDLDTWDRMLVIWLVVTGTWMDYDFPIILGMPSSQLTNSIIFQRAWHHQPVMVLVDTPHFSDLTGLGWFSQKGWSLGPCFLHRNGPFPTMTT